MSAEISMEAAPDSVEGDSPELLFRNRITGFDPEVDPATLVPNPLNPRLHPEQQRAAMRGILSEVGWVDTIKVNTRTGLLIDGHERRQEAIEAGQMVPVLYVDLSPEEERLIVSAFDPLASM